MKPAWKILLDLLVNFIVYGNFLAVYNFFDSLAVFVLTGNFCLYGNFFEVILFFYSLCNKAFCNLAYFFCLCLCGNDSAIVDQRCYLVSK